MGCGLWSRVHHCAQTNGIEAILGNADAGILEEHAHAKVDGTWAVAARKPARRCAIVSGPEHIIQDQHVDAAPSVHLLEAATQWQRMAPDPFLLIAVVPARKVHWHVFHMGKQRPGYPMPRKQVSTVGMIAVIDAVCAILDVHAPVIVGDTQTREEVLIHLLSCHRLQHEIGRACRE